MIFTSTVHLKCQVILNFSFWSTDYSVIGRGANHKAKKVNIFALSCSIDIEFCSCWKQKCGRPDGHWNTASWKVNFRFLSILATLLVETF